MIVVKADDREILFENSGMSEIFCTIIEKCLWHEPHTFQEIMEKTNSDPARKEYNENKVYISLLAAFDQGYIAQNRGFFHLTVEGRNKFSEKGWIEALAA
jgi:hypothetical protein